MSDTKTLIPIFGSSLIMVILLFLIAMNSFKNGKFTCNKYILNTYLYIILTINIVALLCLTLEHFKVMFMFSLWQILALFLIIVGIIFILHTINPKMVLLKHTVWLILILGLGLITYPMYVTSDKKLVLSSMLTTIILTVFLSVVAFIKPELISFSMGPVLLMLLIGIIVFEIAMLIIHRKNYKNVKMLFRGISYFVIFLFMGFILYDTKMLQVRAKECVNADYLLESFNIFIDILNIFVRLLGLGR